MPKYFYTSLICDDDMLKADRSIWQSLYGLSVRLGSHIDGYGRQLVTLGAVLVACASASPIQVRLNIGRTFAVACHLACFHGRTHMGATLSYASTADFPRAPVPANTDSLQGRQTDGRQRNNAHT